MGLRVGEDLSDRLLSNSEVHQNGASYACSTLGCRPKSVLVGEEVGKGLGGGGRSQNDSEG